MKTTEYGTQNTECNIYPPVYPGGIKNSENKENFFS